MVLLEGADRWRTGTRIRFHDVSSFDVFATRFCSTMWTLASTEGGPSRIWENLQRFCFVHEPPGLTYTRCSPQKVKTLLSAVFPFALPASCVLASLSGSTSCPRAVATEEGDSTVYSSAPLLSNKKSVEKLWQNFLSDPGSWSDHRSDKGNARYPDFKHNITQEALWLNNKLNPLWVQAKLAAMAPNLVPRSVFSWNRRLTKDIKAGRYEKVLQGFQIMQQEGIIPDRFSFSSVLNACAKLRALEMGREIHSKIIQSGCESDVCVGNSLIDMYTKCGCIEEAWNFFTRMPNRDVISWNTVMLGYVKCGSGQKALELFQRMQKEGVKPDSVTFVGAINACATAALLHEGRLIHEQIICGGFHSDIFVGSSLVDMYAKCGSIEDAETVFSNMPVRNAVVWNTLIFGYVKCGRAQKALDLYRKMYEESVDPVPLTFVGLLNACASLAALEEGRLVHKQIIERGFELDVSVCNSLVDMYGKCGSMEDAWSVFRNLQSPSVIAWSALIFGLVNSDKVPMALDLFQQMQSEGVEPSSVTFVVVLNACGRASLLNEGRCVHEEIIQRGLEPDVFVASALVNMYSKCGSLEEAQRVFDKMSPRNVVPWNALIMGYTNFGQGPKALELFRQMQKVGVDPAPVTFVGVLNACASIKAIEEGRLVHRQINERSFDSNIHVGNSLVDMYAKCDSIEDACEVFNKMPLRNVVTWNSLILGHVNTGQGLRALSLFRRMLQEMVEPDAVTYVSVLNACSSVMALDDGRLVHEQILEKKFDTDVFVGSSLIDMYAKCGKLEDAQSVFRTFPLRNAVSWSVMLAGFARHGQGIEAIDLFEQMIYEKVEIDGATFVSLLSACCHAGLVDEALHCFECMSPVYGILPTVEHYACIVDLLGRAGRLHEADFVITSMPCKVNVAICMALLGACRVAGDVNLGEKLANQVLELDPGNSAAYVLLSNVYAVADAGTRSGKTFRVLLERD